jgi:hypothetical protein
MKQLLNMGVDRLPNEALNQILKLQDAKKTARPALRLEDVRAMFRREYGPHMTWPISFQ